MVRMEKVTNTAMRVSVMDDAFLARESTWAAWHVAMALRALRTDRDTFHTRAELLTTSKADGSQEYTEAAKEGHTFFLKK